MSTWNSQGGRGAALEEELNRTNEFIRKKKLGIVQKIPTPIKPLKIDSQTGRITSAFFEEKSTVDYIGIVQGYPVCFDAKECRIGTSFPLKNVHAHQVEYMKEFEEQGGYSFLIVKFVEKNLTFLLPLSKLLQYYNSIQEGGRKSIPFSDFSLIVPENRGVLNYLVPLSQHVKEEAKEG